MSRRRVSYSIPQHESAKDESVTVLKEIYSTVRYDWPRILEDDANPIELAISLLDDSSVGLAHRQDEFQRLKKSTEGALRRVVHEHYELFNNSIGSYHSLLSTLDKSQQDSEGIKDFLQKSNKEIHDRSAVLAELSETSGKYAESIDIIDAMQQLNKIPDQVEQLTNEKKLHEVFDVISNGCKIAENYNLWSLPAMGDIRAYLDEQSNKLYDMIIDELQNEIYLKNNSSISNTGVSLWQSIIDSTSPQMASFKTLLRSENLEQYVHNSANLDILEVVDHFSGPVSEFLNDQLPELHANSLKNDGAIDHTIYLKKNTSNESFYYMYQLLATAQKLGNLNQVVETLIESNQSELHGLVNRVTEEVKSRNGYALSKLNKIQNFEQDSLLDVMAHKNFSDSAVVILQELFGSITIRYLLSFQKYKIIDGITSILRPGSVANMPPSAGVVSKNVLRVWNSTKKELSNLIVSYIYDDGPLDSGSGLVDKTDNRKVSKALQKRKLFQFENVDWSSTKSAQELQDTLGDIFPGFHIDDTNDEDLLTMQTPYFEDESFNTQVEVLTPKNLFNMRIVLEPLLIFVEGSHRVLSNFQMKKNSTDDLAFDFFKNFMKSSFLTYFKAAIEMVFSDQVGGTYTTAYTSEPSGLKLDVITLNQNTDLELLEDSRVGNESTIVIYENALNFKKLFLELCLILNTSLTYREDISDTVLQILESFANEYTKLFKDLLSSGGASAMGRPASQISKWMTQKSLTHVSGTIILSLNEKNSTEFANFVTSESGMLLRETDKIVVNKDNLLDRDTFAQVVHLLLTTSWILTWLALVQKQSNYAVGEDGNNGVVVSPVERLRYNWSFLENGRPSIDITTDASDITRNNILLALSSEKMIAFKEVISNFESIRDQTLLALRYELRSKAIHYLTLSFNVMDWVPTTEPGDADPYVVQFNQEIFAIDTSLTKALRAEDKDSIFVGFSQFLNDAMIQGSFKVRKINSNGIKRVLLNISTLQQILRSLSATPQAIDFAKSSLYFEMFTLNEFSLLNRIKSKRSEYTKPQYHNLARLIYSEKLADGNGSQFNKDKYEDLIKKINEIIE
ncbi:SEC8 [Candida theae]|uniref:Exocyst complex component Sec8 n=1 Tax=Candida theae TaxID=1198502 RepID=A0AAD5BHY9_9ASCO|nr:SEC8 [Candida theae]KAI5964528.1 SEC8 [Candida theae]